MITALFIKSKLIFRNVRLSFACCYPFQFGGYFYFPVYPGWFSIHPVPSRWFQISGGYDWTYKITTEGKFVSY